MPGKRAGPFFPLNRICPSRSILFFAHPPTHPLAHSPTPKRNTSQEEVKQQETEDPNFQAPWHFRQVPSHFASARGPVLGARGHLPSLRLQRGAAELLPGLGSGEEAPRRNGMTPQPPYLPRMSSPFVFACYQAKKIAYFFAGVRDFQPGLNMELGLGATRWLQISVREPFPFYGEDWTKNGGDWGPPTPKGPTSPLPCQVSCT